MFVDFNILNQLGSPSINSNTFANRPAAGQTGRLFVSTDTFEIYRDNGTGWDLIGGPGAGTITGTGTATQVAYFTGAQTIGSSANLFWDNTNTRLGIGTSSPGVRLDIHGTGNMLQLNATAATANTLMSFQRLGSNVWRLGDQYSGGLNYFELHNAVLNNNAAEFQVSTNKATFSALETYSSGGAVGSLFSYTITVPGGTNFTGPNVIGNVNSALVLNLGGNTTVPNSARQGLEGNSRINFTGAGTLTMTQGTGTVRAFSALSSVYSFAGSAVGTITHLAGLRICFPDNIGSAINITNNYGILINSQTTGTGTVTYTNRWGIYQEASADVNHFAGAILQGTTTNTGFGIYTNSSFRSDTTTYLAALSGGAVIGSTNALSSSALLQLDSTTGGLLIPRLTTTQRNAIVSAAAGLVIYNTTTTALEFYNGTAWTSGGGSIGGSGTTNYLPKFTAATTVGDSRFFDNGTVTFLGNGDVNAAPSTGIFSGTGGSGTNIAGAELRIRGGASTGNAAGGPLTFYTSAAGSAGTGVNAATERMRIDTRGNIGINVTTPSSWNTAIRAIELGSLGGTVITGNTSVGNSSIFGQNLYFDTGFKYAANGVASYYLQNGASHVWYYAASGVAGNAITFTEAMTLNASGNLGLGTATIGSRLQVNGNAAIGYSASTAAPTNGLAVSGNVGIGIASATRNLDIRAADPSMTLRSSNTTGFCEIYFGDSAGEEGRILYGNNGDYFSFYTLSTERMRITSGGEMQLKPAGNTAALTTSGQYSLTGANAQSLLDLAGTWNTTGNPTAIKLNITNTASGATAYLMDLQVGAATQFRVTKAGAIRTAAPTTGTANDWKLGTRVAAAVVLDTTQYIELEVGGTLYKLAIVT